MAPRFLPGMARWAAFAAAAALGACQTPGVPHPNAPDFVPARGSRLILNQPLTIPAHQAHVDVQDGAPKDSDKINRYYPYCRFESWRLKSTPQRIAPDTFTVTRAGLQEEANAGARVRLAAAGVLWAGDPSFVVYATSMRLRSLKQPDVYRLVCAQWAVTGPDAPTYLSLDEIRRALGGVATLELP